MAEDQHRGVPDIAAERLERDDYIRNFSDLHEPLSVQEARVEAERCYFCYDAPCMTACPTSIDIAMFIRQIAAGNPNGAAKTIFDQNIFGGMCARVCPTEILCEGACVRMTGEGRPIRIGELQRYATDHYMALSGSHPFSRAAPTGRRVAVVGAGPAGLACAHRLAVHGHDVVVFEARDKPGGLNEYGVAAYKTVDDFAQREVEFVLAIGGITIETGKALGRDFSLGQLARDFDAVFLGIGLEGVNRLGVPGEDLEGVLDATAWIAELRQARDLSKLPIGRRVVVIGGGMTAIDAAIQSKLLGAEEVTIVYRRGKEHMNASRLEQELAQTRGVLIRHWARPVSITGGSDGRLRAIEFETTREEGGRLVGSGETFSLRADMVFKAIGQTLEAGCLDGAADKVGLKGGRIGVDHEGRAGLAGVWAGGDCVAGGEDLTVTAVEDGKRAAESIHRALTG